MRKSKHLKPGDMIELLTPIAESAFPANRCSVWELEKNMESILGKMRKSGNPIHLMHRGIPVALICDFQTYLELEKRRQSLAALLEEFPKADNWKPKVGKPGLNPTDPRIRELMQCIRSVDRLEKQTRMEKGYLYDTETALKKSKEEMSKILGSFGPVQI